MLAAGHRRIAETVEQAIRVLDQRDYTFSIKYDGVRIMATIDNGRVRLVSRSGVSVTDGWPEVADALADRFPRGRWMLDAEMLVHGADGRPDFTATHRRAAQSRATAALAARTHPATLAVFDVLTADSVDIRDLPQYARQAQLAALGLAGGTLATVREFASGTAGWEHVDSRGHEGLIAKARWAPYRAGRSNDWIKLKRGWRVSAVVVGTTAGTGQRTGGIGALHLALLEGGAPVTFGRVGSGLSVAEGAQIGARLAAGELPVIEIELTGVFDDGTARIPRHPVYVGLRSDMTPLQCSTDQLADVPVLVTA
jgi:bifunctional non-homologous end joining protein LigD